MQSLSARVYSLLSSVFFIVALVLRLVMFLADYSTTAGIFFYLFTALGIACIGLEVKNQNNLSKAFEFNNNYHLNLFSYIASLGFFICFVNQCINIFKSVENGVYNMPTYFVPICVICLFALLSCFYFYTVGMSYGDRGYDFRELKLLHFAPIVWSVAFVLSVMTMAISPLREIDSTLKCIVLVFSVVFFYFFASEIVSDKPAKKATVFFSKAFAGLSIMFFVDMVMLLITRNIKPYDNDFILSISLLMISLFVFFFERNITKIIKGA